MTDPNRFGKRLRPDQLAHYMYDFQCDEIMKKSYWPIIRDERVTLQSLFRHSLAITKQLEHTRHFYLNHEHSLSRKWLKCYNNGIKLKNYLKKYNEFICDNENKRVRAIHQREEERHLAAKYEEQAEEMRNKVVALRASKIQMDRSVKSMALYEDFIERFVEVCTPEFKSSMEVVDRFNSLQRMKVTIMHKEHRLYKHLERAQRKLESIQSARFASELGMKSRIGELQKRYNKAVANVKKYETILSAIQSQSESRMQTVRLLHASIANLYRYCCKLRQWKGAPPNQSVEQQMALIKQTMRMYDQIRSKAAQSSVDSKSRKNVRVEWKK